jgi:hypothetical protein
VDRFVATVENGKSVGRAPVNEEIVEDLLQRMKQSSKNSSGSYHFRLMYRWKKPELLFTQNHNTSRTSTRWFWEALRILQLVFEQFEWWQVPNNEFELNNLNF